MRLLLALLLSTLLFTGCKKNAEDIFCLDGTIEWGGDPKVDGAGWLLVTKGEDKPKKYGLNNLPDAYKIPGLAVNACLVEIDCPPCPSMLLKPHTLITIRKL